jgi:hypothetical protein
MDRYKKARPRFRQTENSWEMTDCNHMLNRHPSKSSAVSDNMQPPALFMEKAVLWVKNIWRLFRKQ